MNEKPDSTAHACPRGAAKMAEVSRQAVHRPGPLKQQNKVHKHGKHKSKGEIASEAKGELLTQWSVIFGEDLAC